ncbi:MAG: hypothetical protein CMA72_09740 [Euryarchaeota archaeon]|nr:hypothetical protein [Euryarchaeota archaeon]|tara:strand:+ start:4959 stop:5921 length:963 start_codon:yes stop_codon:yes gene_type:complete
MKKLVELLFEQSGAEDELHVFDFDDTLGITDAPTLVAAVEFNGGDPDDPESYDIVSDLDSRLSSTTGKLQKPSSTSVSSPGVVGDKVKNEDPLIDDAQVVVVDTAQYRDWKEKYVRGGKHSRVVVGGNVGKKIKDAAKQMADEGRSGEIHVVDFSPSSTLGIVDPIDVTLNLLATKVRAGAETAVVTARKGETDLDTFGGKKKKAQNADDIIKFIQDEKGVKPDEVFGAADISNATAANKRKIIKYLIAKSDAEEIHFYDDDPENIRATSELCDDPDLEGRDLYFYNAEFHKDGIPTAPVHCSPQIEESRWIKIAGILKG